MADGTKSTCHARLRRVGGSTKACRLSRRRAGAGPALCGRIPCVLSLLSCGHTGPGEYMRRLWDKDPNGLHDKAAEMIARPPGRGRNTAPASAPTRMQPALGERLPTMGASS